MTMQKLSQSVALSEGADLWILADAKHCSWTPKVDWLLNFQMARAKSYESRDLPRPIVEIIEQNEMQWKAVKASPAWPLMISTNQRLPNHQVVELPYDGDKAVWVKKASEIWSGLKNPSLRLFLPDGLSEQDVLDYWPEAKSESLVSFVSEQRNS